MTASGTLGTVVIIGGSSAIGQAIAAHYAQAGHSVVVTSRSLERAHSVAQPLGATALAVDLTQSLHEIKHALQSIGSDIQYLILVAVVRCSTHIVDGYDVQTASALLQVKTVGYQSVIHTLLPRMRRNASICIFGGAAKDVPYPGSTAVTTANGAVHSMVHTLAVQLGKAYKNIRVNGLHPGLVADSPHYADKPGILKAFGEKTLLEDLITIADVVHATVFLLENPGITGINLPINAGFHMN